MSLLDCLGHTWERRGESAEGCGPVRRIWNEGHKYKCFFLPPEETRREEKSFCLPESYRVLSTDPSISNTNNPSSADFYKKVCNDKSVSYHLELWVIRVHQLLHPQSIMNWWSCFSQSIHPSYHPNHDVAKCRLFELLTSEFLSVQISL